MSPVFTWKFEEKSDLSPWTTAGSGNLRLEGRHLQVVPSPEREFIQLVRQVDFEARAVHSLSLEARNLRRGRLRLFWAGPGEKFAQERSLQLDVAKAGTGGSWAFDLLAHRGWRGKIESLRLDLPNVDETMEIRSISGQRYRFDPERLARAVGENLKVELDHDVRNAVLTPPGVAVPWVFEQPVRGRLRFAYGVSAGANPPVRFRISRADGSGERVTVFEAAVDPREPSEAGRWHEGSVELTTATEALFLAADAEAGYELGAGIPAWANPEILQRADPGPPSVILISVDTLRPDRLSLYGYSEPTSPQIDAWAARRAVTFRSAVSTAPWTLPSHVSMLTGLDALSHGVNYSLPAPLELTTLAEILRAAGYTTLGVTGGGWLHPRNGLHQGFDSFRYWHRGMGAESEIREGMDRTLELIEKYADRSFFLFFHTYEVHDPYRRRLPYGAKCAPSSPDAEKLAFGATGVPREGSDDFRLFYRFVKWRLGEPARSGVPISPQDLSWINCLYDSSIAYADRQLGRLFEKLRQLDLESRVVVVLTSDHGESLGEDGLAKHAYLVDTNLLVPLAISLPGARAGGEVVEAQVSTVDIVPTLLDFLGLEPAAGIDGRSLLPFFHGAEPQQAREAWSYAADSNFGLSLRSGRWKYTFNNTAWAPPEDREKLYRLRSGSEELLDPTQANSEDVARLRSRLAEHLETRSKGILVRVENSSCGHLDLRLEGLAIKVNRVKTDPRVPAALQWLGNGEAGFRVEPGEVFNVLLEGARGRLTLKAVAEPCGAARPEPFEAALRLDELTEPWQQELVSGRWRAESGGDPRDARILIRREGQVIADGEPQAMDPALLEQLRALGYVP